MVFYIFQMVLNILLTGKCFQEANESMKASYGSYCAQFEDCIIHLNKIQESPAIKAWMESRMVILKRHFNVFDLASVLIKPLQRILKYPLFIKELINVRWWWLEI